MSIHFWVATHLGSNNRVEMFQAMLNSIKSQTIQPDHIWISLSHNPSIIVPSQAEVQNILGDNFTMLVSNTKLHQFQHLHKIWENDRLQVKWVMFCDDDDLNGPERISSFKHILSENPDKMIFVSGTGHFYNNLYRENEPWITDYTTATSRFADTIRADFGSYICHISKIDQFFDEMYKDGICKFLGQTDLLFMAWLPRPIRIPGIDYAKRSGSYQRDYLTSTGT